MSNMCDLPEDVVTEVLVRVEPEMAPRLRCVSKSWQTLIDSPEFRHKRFGGITQLIYLSCRNSQLYMTRCMDGPKKMIPDISIETEYKNESKVLVGSCNGVLCLLFNESKVAVLNPCTKQSLELPQVQPKCGYWKSIGFGYDHVHDDYKVVRLAQDGVNLYQVKVYSFGLKCWRDLDHVEFFNGKHKVVLSDRGIFANGALHWIIFDGIFYGNFNKHAILAYDLATEKFRLLPLIVAEADDALFGYEYEYGLGDVDGCLSFFLRKHDKCGMWMMKEDGVQDSWTKLSLQTPNLFSSWKISKRLSSWRRNLLRCNFDARRILKPTDSELRILDDYLVFRNREDLICHNDENEVEDLILWNVPNEWRTVFTFTPSLVNLPTQN